MEEFREAKVGFVSARVSPETIIDIRPDPSGEKVTPNIDHYCLVLGPTDMKKLHSDLKAKGVRVEEEVRPAWGAKGYSFTPFGQHVELDPALDQTLEDILRNMPGPSDSD